MLSTTVLVALCSSNWAGNAGRQFGVSSVCTREEEWALELEVLIHKKPIFNSSTAYEIN